MEQLVSSTYIKIQGNAQPPTASPHAPALHMNSSLLHFYGPSQHRPSTPLTHPLSLAI
ncbi:hypothetical protein AZE42_01228 [Rhizopogon vesiculosus]|uniref:Uncharacterized protein n=1 Tax=Rhizopogon vesiculosus TaxID=180088 RepID=A0A1J8Q9C7_9AGAM|nr:hypothetical protein AZE42_01228 [Rhizopogon vesiculosus]